jgi:hypothetical protein
MQWETPTSIDINMSAEIGAYQDEFEDRAPGPADFVEPLVVYPDSSKG